MALDPISAGLLPIGDASSESNSLVYNASQTEIRVEHLKHSWTVKNFSHCYQEYLENYVNLRNTEHTWSIKIYPKGNGENNKDFVFLCLNKVPGSNPKVNKSSFRSHFYLKNSEGKDIEMRVHPNPSHSDFVSYIKRDVLFPQISPTDSVTVLLEIDVAFEAITVSLDDQADLGKKRCYCDKPLANDFLKLFQDEILTDFVIKVGDKEIKAHKAILAGRSSVFEAMLYKHKDTSESKTGFVEIEGIDYNVVRELLNFIYSGQTSPDAAEFASDLLIAADRYGLVELKDHCERLLIKNIVEENVCDLLMLSDSLNDSVKLIREHAVRFITQYPKKITSTLGWQTLIKNYPHLMTDILNSFDKDDSGPSQFTTSEQSAAVVPSPNQQPQPQQMLNFDGAIN